MHWIFYLRFKKIFDYFLLSYSSEELGFRLQSFIILHFKMKQPHGRMSTKWTPITGGIQRDGGITGGVTIT